MYRQIQTAKNTSSVQSYAITTDIVTYSGSLPQLALLETKIKL